MPASICLANNEDKANPDPVARDAINSCSEINSLSVGGGDEKTGLTVLASDACTSVDVLGKHFTGSSLQPVQGDIQDITAYFHRPRIIASGPLNSTQVPVYNQFVDTPTIFNVWFPLGASRLAQVTGMRYTLVFTLQVATTPFQQGIVLLNFQYGEAAGSGYNQTIRLDKPGMQTNVPHVRLDIAESTMVQLRVPWLACLEYTALSYGIIYGNVAVTNLLPVLIGAGAVLPTYKLMVHLEDVELIGGRPDEVITATLQSGGRVSAVAKEFEDEGKPFSSMAMAASRTLRFLSVGVPAISSFTGPPAWALAQAAKAIRYFGYAKPTIQDPPMRMLIQSHANETNVDMPSAVTNIGSMQCNTLAVSSNFAHTDVDEMSFAYILGQYSQLLLGFLSTTTTTGTAIYACPITPAAFWYRQRFTGTAPFCNKPAPVVGTDVTKTGFVPTNVFFLGSTFRYWKGGFRFRFSFAKTKFHGGRLLVSYIPKDIPTGSVPNGGPAIIEVPNNVPAPQPSGYSMVWNFRDGNAFEFDVPFVYYAPYLSFFDCMGSLSVQVLDPLVAPSTVSQSVQWLVEVKALPDFELAVPQGPRYPPVTVEDSVRIVYQSGGLVATTTERDASECIGEKLQSVKQLIQIPKIKDAGTIPTGATDTLYLVPWYYGKRNLLTAAPAVWTTESFGYGNYFARAYMFLRGSTDYHVYPRSAGAADVYMSLSAVPNMAGFPSAAANNASNTPSSNCPRVIHTTTQTGAHARFPFFSNVARLYTACLSNLDANMNFQSGLKTWATDLFVTTPDVFGRLFANNVGATDIKIQLTRAAGDDAVLGQYIGPPVLGLLVAPTGTFYDPDSTNTN